MTETPSGVSDNQPEAQNEIETVLVQGIRCGGGAKNRANQSPMRLDMGQEAFHRLVLCLQPRDKATCRGKRGDPQIQRSNRQNPTSKHLPGTSRGG